MEPSHTPFAKTVNEVHTAKCSYNDGGKNKALTSASRFLSESEGEGEGRRKGEGACTLELSSGNSTALNIIQHWPTSVWRGR